MGLTNRWKPHLIGLLLTVIYCYVDADVMANTLKANKVEFKIQASLDPSYETPKDCYEFLYGKLSAIRQHGTTWQNGVADCSNCICDNGDIRCFFHFCSEPSTGYMTPPTTDGGVVLPPPAAGYNSFLPENPQEVEGSGFPQVDFGDQETDEGGIEAELSSAFETSSVPSALILRTEGREEGNRTENETHMVANNYFCEKTCRKVCPQGFKIDLVTGCWKCGCATCPSHLMCKIKCPFGYALDPATGCRTCSCASASESKDQDIVFTGEEVGAILLKKVGRDGEEGEVEKGKEGNEEGEASESGGTNMSIIDLENEGENALSFSSSASSSSSSSSQEGDEESNEEDEEELEEGEEEEEGNKEEWKFSQSALRSLGRGATPAEGRASEEEVGTVTSFPSMKEGTLGFHDDGKEPCNATQLRGCLDGSHKFPVGGSWSRGPCVTCRCMAQGYSECNITQCHALHNCPVFRHTTPPGACCAICKEDTPNPVFFDRKYESRSTSRVPTDLPIPRQGEGDLLQKEKHLVGVEKKATVKSVPKDNQWALLLILIPMGVVCGVAFVVVVHLWRRYHRDKYDINACRPEEKQKLRPVKTLHDDASSLGHV